MNFEKISYDQYLKDCIAMFGEENIGAIERSYEEIKLPKRSTAGSAGYDFFFQFDDVVLRCGETICIPTGIKANMDSGLLNTIGMGNLLAIVPRSGLGFKYRIQLDNTIGIIDSDYYNNEENEGHIMIKITNDGKEGKSAVLKKGKGYAQGIFLFFAMTDDDESSGVRAGGFGSTDRK